MHTSAIPGTGAAPGRHDDVGGEGARRSTGPGGRAAAGWRALLVARRNALLRAIVYLVLLLACSGVVAQVGAMYRCPANDYSNAITAPEARARGCTKLFDAEWVFHGSDALGRKYEYNERRTVFRGDGTIETWVQMTPSAARSPDILGTNGSAAPPARVVSPHVIRCGSNSIVSGPTYFYYPHDATVVRDDRAVSPYFPPPPRIAEVLIRQLCADRRSTATGAADARLADARYGATIERDTGAPVRIRYPGH